MIYRMHNENKLKKNIDMINDFLKTAQSGLLGLLAKETQVGENNLHETADVVVETFKDGLMDKFRSGDLNTVAALLHKGGTTSIMADDLVSRTIVNLISKLGLSKEMATSVSKLAVPYLIDKLQVFAANHGKSGESGVKAILGSLVSGSIGDQVLGGFGKKTGK